MTKTKKKEIQELQEADLNDEQLVLYEQLVSHGQDVIQLELNREDEFGALKVASIGSDSPEQEAIKMIKTMGTKSVKAATLLLEQVAELYTGNNDQLDKVNYALSLIHNIAPRDDVEAMLVSQMLATQFLSMECSKKAGSVDNYEVRKIELTMANRLMNTFTSQMITLNKYRGNGQQKMTVEHVHVNEGGQAIIGNVGSGANGGN